MTAIKSNRARKVLDLKPHLSLKKRGRKAINEETDNRVQGKITPEMRAYLKTFDEYLEVSNSPDDDEVKRRLFNLDVAFNKVVERSRKGKLGKLNDDYEDQ